MDMGWPAPLEQLLQFNVALRGRKLVVKCIRGYFEAIAFYSMVYGFNEFTVGFRLSKMFRGWNGEILPQATKSLPFTMEVILTLELFQGSLVVLSCRFSGLFWDLE